MRNHNVCTPIKSAGVLFLLAALVGCAAGGSNRIIKSGDKVGMHFTCTLPNGEIAAVTRPERAKGHLAPIYLKRTGDDPLLIAAGAVSSSNPASVRKSFEDEIVDRLAGAVIGAKQGATISLDLAAERIAGLPPEEQYVKMARVRKRAKEMKMTRAEYQARTGKEPAVGQPFLFDPLVPGLVTEVAAAEVAIRFAAQPDSEVLLPFGKGVIREKEDRYEIEISAVKGSLVRAGGMVGRVTEVDGEFIELDFGHPFGGETLHCEVTVASAEPGEKKTDEPIADDVPGAVVRTGKGL